jgi:predicted transcriptional regulator of viral defense system
MNKNKIDSELLYNYLMKINSSVLNKRVGYLLEKNRICIKNLKINNKYECLNINLGKIGARNKKWKLIINEDL